MFETLGERLAAVLKKISGRGVLRPEDVDAGLREVRLALFEADVNFKVVKEFVERVRTRLQGVEVAPGLNGSTAGSSRRSTRSSSSCSAQFRGPSLRAAPPDRDHARRAAGLGQDHDRREAGAAFAPPDGPQAARRGPDLRVPPLSSS